MLAYVHGARHNLWWEFRLRDSFRWQALVAGLPPEDWPARLERLAGALGIRHLLDRRVEELAPAQRALADLAVALLPRPRVLVWEEPFAALGPGDRRRAVRLVRRLQAAEGLVLAVVGPAPAELGGGQAAAGQRAGGGAPRARRARRCGAGRRCGGPRRGGGPVRRWPQAGRAAGVRGEGQP